MNMRELIAKETNSLRTGGGMGFKEVIEFFQKFGKVPTVLPADDPVGGCIGFSLFTHFKDDKGETQEAAANPNFQFRPEVSEKIEAPTVAELESYYNDALKRKWIITNFGYVSYNTKSEKVGFIVQNSDGCILYWMPRDKYEENKK